jgi:YidC/Oxa1 family membrane protein insertase
MSDSRNTILAIVLSAVVLIAWQFFYNIPQMEKQRLAEQTRKELSKKTQPANNAATPQDGAASAPQADASAAAQPASPAPAPVVARDIAIAASPRVKIDTPRVTGSISLKGARIDDLSLVQFRETVDPASPAIVLYSPSGTAEPYYAEFGWVPATGTSTKIPDANTVWQQEGSNSLTPTTPVTLKYDNDEGLTFHRVISIDDRYLFTIKDEVANVGKAPVTLLPYALISRHGIPMV